MALEAFLGNSSGSPDQGHDSATPVVGGDNVATGLSNSYNIVFPDGTHIQEHDPCGMAMMDAFMTDPLTEPDTSCVNQAPTFAVPCQVTDQR